MGDRTVATYTVLLLLAITGSLALLLWRTPAGQRAAVADACLGGLAGGLLLARLVHVALHWRYFTYNIPEIGNLLAGGLDWRGAVVGAVFGAGLVGRWRGLALPALLDRLAPALPVIALAAWWGCGAAACAGGAEIARMSAYPPLFTWEAADSTGMVAPRFATQPLGMAGAALLLPLALWLRRPRYAGQRFAVLLALLALLMLALSLLRGDAMPRVFGLRGDTVLDAVLLLWALLLAARAARPASP
ncbi:MAG: prolipoprotein diacylglyceryl transferase [Anaerolineae bacterium]|jgi:prolipoprotein diacylglyceryltransferase|nr:prolipoprotein diacylglyceryl transferase [Anaerolineae bacterium]